MKIRRRGLPLGWYPSSGAEIRDSVQRWATFAEGDSSTVAGVLPHAGWAFCGPLITRVLASLADDLETVVIAGGHNPAGGPFVRYTEDSWDSPTGLLDADIELSQWMDERFPSQKEWGVDNTVEVVIPALAALRGNLRWAAWRLPADERAVDFGEALAQAADDLGRRIAVVGSTDLTHYGPNYGFQPAESLENPRAWAEERDRRILGAFIEQQEKEALHLASIQHSACSVGGAVAASAFARCRGARQGRLLAYTNSADVVPGDSFVGYGALIWSGSTND